MPNSAQISPAQALQGYGAIWIIFFVMSLISAFCCSVFQVPLAQAVNVQLAVTLAMNIFVLGLYSIMIAILLVMMQLQQVFILLLVAFLYMFFTLAPMAAFQLWAMFTNVDLNAESFMYAMVGDRLQATVEATLSSVGNLFG